MKNIITLLGLLAIACCLPSSLKAAPVGKQAALYTAKSFMQTKGKSLTAGKNLKFMKKAASDEAADTEPFYIFGCDDDNGYVIVSADDRVEPILGYVEQGSFDADDIPENMRSWLQFYADQIRYIIDNDIDANSPLLRKPNKAKATRRSIPELLKTRWNQGKPYNITCPKYYKEDGTQDYPAAGCVATAMAQVINFYQYPDKTKAAIPAHSNKYTLKDGTQQVVSLPAIPRNTTIDWENMRDTYSWENEDKATTQDTAVANLMLLMGQSVKMGYGASSGASTSRARDVYVNYFGFDERAYWGNRSNYGIDEWFDMLYKDISEGYPVLFAGHSSGGGHAFVLDGFDGEGLFHVNWGWGGGSNGYFLVNILNPGDNSGIGASSSSDGYSMSQGAVFNLRVPDNTKPETSLNINSISITSSAVKATFENKTGSTGTYNTGIVMKNDDGTFSLVGTQQTITSMATGTSQTKTFNLKNKLPEGTYRLSPASKLSRSTTWHPVYNMRDKYIKAVVDSTGNLALNLKNPVYDISIDTIVFPGTRIAGKEQEVKVTFRNNADEYFKTIYLLASNSDNKVYTDNKSMVAVREGETTEVSYFFTPDTIGTYNLWFSTDDKGNNIVGTGTMEVIEESKAAQANLTVSSYTISNAASSTAYGKQLIGKATIRNNARTPFRGSVKLQLWNQQVGSSTAYSGPSKTYYLEIAAGKTTTVDFNFEGLNEGYYYRLPASYVNQSGNLTGGGLWDNRWEMKSGMLMWKNDGTVSGKAYAASLSVTSAMCGVYVDCNKKVTRFTPNKSNPNAIYAFHPDMEVPATLDTSNVVSGNHASHIKLVNDKPYYIPISFDADTATFTYTFPETEMGMGWHAFTMPFEADSIFVDGLPVQLNDSLGHFWVYEFSEESDDGKVVFAPATILRGGTPYIIAGDMDMAGRSVVFRSTDVPFYKTGSDRMVVSSPGYKFIGNTHAPKYKDCYMLNDEGTAFEYVTTNKLLGAMASYFMTNLSKEERLSSIVLPPVPISDDPDGIKEVESSGKEIQSPAIYNITGQRIYNPVRGIYIKDGKKILHK